MTFGSISLLEGLNTSGAFNFFVDSGDKYLMSIHPKKVGKTGRLSQKVRGFSPLMICSIIGKYDSLAVIKWSKHCPMSQLSAFGFQLSCCAVKSPNVCCASATILPASAIKLDKPSSDLLITPSYNDVLGGAPSDQFWLGETYAPGSSNCDGFPLGLAAPMMMQNAQAALRSNVLLGGVPVQRR